MTQPDRPREDLLYHYTAGKGFLGILDSEVVWATQAEFLNDGSEISYAMKVAAQVLPEFRTRNPTGIDALVNHLVTFPRATPWLFIISFTENGDDLTQWRGYGSAGDSYSLGFDFDGLRRLASNQGWHLAQCVYEPDAQRDLIRQTVDDFLVKTSDGHAIVDPDDPDPDARFLRHCDLAIGGVAPRLKHAAFDKEAEWRLWLPPRVGGADTKFRSGSQSLIPYTEFRLRVPPGEVIPLRKVVIGPGALDPEAAGDAVHSLLYHNREKLIEGCQQSLSEIPFRDW